MSTTATTTATPPIPPLPMPTPSELSDILYYSRTGDLPSLQTLITQLCQTHSCSPSTLLTACIDVPPALDQTPDPESDLTGTGNTPLHYASANAHLPVLSYLLSLLSPAPAHTNGVTANLSPTVIDKSASTFVDQRNQAGNTALHWACVNGELGVVRMLVEEGGADVGVRNGEGRDCLGMGRQGEDAGVEGAGEVVGWLEVWIDRMGGNKGVGEDVEEVGDVVGGERNGEHEKQGGQRPTAETETAIVEREMDSLEVQKAVEGEENVARGTGLLNGAGLPP